MSEFTFELHHGQVVSAVDETDRAQDQPGHVRETDAEVDRCPRRLGTPAAAGRLQGRPVQGLALDSDRPLHG